MGTPAQKHAIEKGMTIMMVMVIPIAVAVHTVIAYRFAMTVQPMWHTTIFAPYYVTGATCHIIGGISNDWAPDLSRRDTGNSFGSLSAQLWNHFPSMDIRLTRRGIKWPRFTEKEIVELTAFLYFITYLGDPGDRDNGKAPWRRLVSPWRFTHIF